MDKVDTPGGDFGPKVKKMAAQYAADGKGPDLKALFLDLRSELKAGPRLEVGVDPTNAMAPAAIGVDADSFTREDDFKGWEHEAVPALLLAAAVLISYDPRDLLPLPSQPPQGDNGALLAVQGFSTMILSLGQSGQQEPRWCLPDNIRRPALQFLARNGLVQSALAANLEHSSRGTDPVQVCLARALGGDVPPLAQARLTDLTALRRVCEWLPKTAFPWMPDGTEVSHYVEREQLLTPFRAMIGRWNGAGEFREYFQGRQAELRQLRIYVDIVEAEGLLEAAGRFVTRTVSQVFDLRERPPLLIRGEGGVGKSTLLAKFILQHAAAFEKMDFPFVYIDFDRPDIRVSEPMTVLAEACRQLSIQMAAGSSIPTGATLDAEFSDLGREILTLFSAWTPVSSVAMTEAAATRGSGALQAERKQMLDRFSALCSRLDQPDRPFLLVLDTFEEVQYRSRDHVSALYEFLQDLQKRVPRLRTVLAGRVQVTQFPTEEIVLADLDAAAAAAFLKANGVRDRNTAQAIIDYVGRQPLSLVLAIDLLGRDPEGLRTLSDTGKPTPKKRSLLDRFLSNFRRDWDGVAVQGRLFDRILEHVHDRRLQKIVHPGLILRRVTADLILKVLAGPCDLALSGQDDAQALFAELEREVAMVAPAEPGALRVRSDLRRVMLPLIIQADRETARLIQEAAVTYYSQQEGAAARAEEIYHRLMLGQSPSSVQMVWRDDVGELLRSSIEELPAPAQAFVAARIQADLPDDVWDQADQPDWMLYAERRASELLQHGKADEALNLLNQRDVPATGEMQYLHALSLERLGRADEASGLAAQALESLPATSEYEGLRASAMDIAGERFVDSGAMAEPAAAATRESTENEADIVSDAPGASTMASEERAGSDSGYGRF